MIRPGRSIPLATSFFTPSLARRRAPWPPGCKSEVYGRRGLHTGSGTSLCSTPTELWTSGPCDLYAQRQDVRCFVMTEGPEFPRAPEINLPGDKSDSSTALDLVVTQKVSDKLSLGWGFDYVETPHIPAYTGRQPAVGRCCRLRQLRGGSPFHAKQPAGVV